ncbi:MAG: GTPase ObgE [Myxococcales bacterium]|nr:GTPase ObgE [Myxococcales bacterium]
MKFVDEVKVFVQSGAGGDGCLSFRKEKYVPRGGPDGGDGGNGGDVVFVTDSSKNTLIDLAYKPQYRAKHGVHGKGKTQHGKNAPHLYVHLPAGVVVFDGETGEMVVDLDEPDREWIAAKGGRGGRGNARFLSNANRAPLEHEKGFPGEERWYRLVLKSIADVGLIGYPSVGKSTLIAAISSARPKVGAYPFTTLHPNLGTVDRDFERRFVVADLPGLIEGAHAGAGLGIRFLRHIERTRLLVHLLDLDPHSGRDPLDDFHKLNHELSSYSEELGRRPQVIAANKIDLPDGPERLEALREAGAKEGLAIYPVSAREGRGIAELLDAIEAELAAMNRPGGEG